MISGTAMLCGQWEVHWPQPMQAVGFTASSIAAAQVALLVVSVSSL